METMLKTFMNATRENKYTIALKERNRELTYEQLHNESNKIASFLIENGLQKGQFVAIYLKRSIDTVVAILGIIKAGGTYVSLDPSHPNDRNDYIIDDIQTNFIISNEGSKPKLNTLQLKPTIKVLMLEDMQKQMVPVSFQPIEDDIQDVCYTIFTSGTTGKPKGTLIRQQGVLNLVEYMQKEWQVTAQDRILQFATYSFDASVLDTFLALMTGATLYLIDDEERMSEYEFLQVVQKEQITVIPVLPTVFFNRIVNALTEQNAALFTSVKLVGVGGELLTGDLARKFKTSLCGDTRFFNLYGPTEITVMATAFEVPKTLAENVYSVPIGQQLPGNKTYVVNEQGELCAVGEVGELWVASVGISLGYLHNADKTAQVFVKNPFDANLYEGIVYKTGDLVKRLIDGNLEFVSRKDTQVKIRGHRIEIAEIETKMNEIEGVQNAVVVVEKEDDEQILKAFFTARQALNTTVIIDTLKQDLPSYMLPTKMLQLEDIPFAPTGKVDRKVLTKIDAPRVTYSRSTTFVAPRNEVEQEIADVWKKVLKLDEVSVIDNLFDIGGHSLKVIEMLSYLKQSYPMLSIKDFFDLKTVENLANKVLTTSAISEQQFNGEYTHLTEWPKMEVTGALPDANTILVTGATGFLGSHIAHKLLNQGKHVVLLVRGETAQQRIQQTMEQYFGEPLSANASVVIGDMTERYFGIGEKQFAQLASSLDAIIHAAADVRHFGAREHFEKVNVEGTKNIFELLTFNNKIAFHHISTVGVVQDLLAEGKWSQLHGATQVVDQLTLDSVYTDTKMQAENWVLQQVQQGKQVFVYRMGNLVGRYSDGQFQKNIHENAFYRTLKLILLVKKAPKVQWMVDFTPIDFAAQVITKSVLTSHHTERVYHVCHPNPIPFEQLVAVLNELDINIEMTSKEEFEQFILSEHVSEEVKNLAVAQLDGDGANDTDAVFDSTGTMQRLQIDQLPVIDKVYIKKLLEYAIKQSFMQL